MSVAYHLDPQLPSPAQSHPRRSATVTTLHRPSPGSIAAPVRLTRRGVHAVVAAVAALAVGLVATAWLSAPAALPAHRATPDTVVVRAGDTLWSIAGRLAPGRDPLAEVEVLRRLNQLHGSALYPGQVLRAH